MAHDSLGAFDFTFDPSLDGMDDFQGMEEAPDQEGLFLPNIEGRTEFLAPDPDKIPLIENAVKQDSAEYAQRPAEDRTRELFGQMRPHRSVLLGVIDAAREPFPMEEMSDAVKELREHRFSVYSPSNLCTMLEVAGALERVLADGTPYTACTPKPTIVVIDGEEYYEPARPPKVFWKATAAGLAMVDEDDPLERTARLFERELDLRVLYKRVLTMAQAEEGATMAQMSIVIDDDPLICEPRRFYVQHFVESLERTGALAWQGSSWKTTDAGLDALNLLSNVEDDFDIKAALAAAGEPRVVLPAETDGINW